MSNNSSSSFANRPLAPSCFWPELIAHYVLSRIKVGVLRLGDKGWLAGQVWLLLGTKHWFLLEFCLDAQVWQIDSFAAIFQISRTVVPGPPNASAFGFLPLV